MRAPRRRNAPRDQCEDFELYEDDVEELEQAAPRAEEDSKAEEN